MVATITPIRGGVIPKQEATDAPNTTVLPDVALKRSTMEQAGGRKLYL